MLADTMLHNEQFLGELGFGLWDEALVTYRQAFEDVSRLLQDLRGNRKHLDLLFRFC